MDTLTVIAALLGGGTIATLAALVLHYRSDNAKAYAEARKTSTDADVAVDDSVQRRYDSLFGALEIEVKRLRDNEAECRSELVEQRKTLNDTQRQLGEFRVEAANATADVKLARAEIVRLQDRLDRIEHAQ